MQRRLAQKKIIVSAKKKGQQLGFCFRLTAVEIHNRNYGVCRHTFRLDGQIPQMRWRDTVGESQYRADESQETLYYGYPEKDGRLPSHRNQDPIEGDGDRDIRQRRCQDDERVGYDG